MLATSLPAPLSATEAQSHAPSPRPHAPAASQYQRVRLGVHGGRDAPAVTVPLSVRTSEQAHVVLSMLDLDPSAARAVICVIGGASGLHEVLVPRLRSLMMRGVARVAARLHAHVLDGGTDSGIMRMLGAGVEGVRAATSQWGDEEEGASAPASLIGICPARCVRLPPARSEDGAEDMGSAVAAVEAARDASLVDLEPHHTHFVLPDGRRWGTETGVMFAIAGALAALAPAVAIVANGGSMSRKEVLQAVRHRIPIVVLKGTGRLADELAVRLSVASAGVNAGDVLHGMNIAEVEEEEEEWEGKEDEGGGWQPPGAAEARLSGVNDAVDTQESAEGGSAPHTPGSGLARRVPSPAPLKISEPPMSASQELDYIVRNGIAHIFDIESSETADFITLLERLLDADRAAIAQKERSESAVGAEAPTV